MGVHKASTLGPIKKITFAIMVIMVLILFSLILLHNYDRQRSLNDKILINIFGKQRMYTQLIGKDAGYLYAYLLEKESNQSKEAISDQEISDVINSMEDARMKYFSVLDQIHRKQITYHSYTVKIDSEVIENSQYLKKIDTLWAEFDEAVRYIGTVDESAADIQEKVKYINDNNIELLQLSDQLLEQLLNDSIHMDRIMQIVEYILVGLLLIAFSLYIYHLMRFIILPYNQLFKGITEIGLYSYPANQSFPTRKKVIPLVEEVSDVFKKINQMISMIENINNNNSFVETLSYISHAFSAFIPYNYIGIALISEDKEYFKASYGVSDGTIKGLPENIMGSCWPVSETSLGALLESKNARIINDLEEYCKNKTPKPYNNTILEAGIHASIALPLQVSGEPVGMIFFSSNKKNVYNEAHVNILRTLANSIAISLNQNIFASEMQYSSILALAKLSEARDEDTGEHMERMAKYSRKIAEILYQKNTYPGEISIEYIDNLERFSPLHDIGKVGIRDGILLKPGKLTPVEFDEMKKHTLYGADVLKSADKNMKKKGKSLYGMGTKIAESHHEKWDGNGYPFGKKGTEIPLCARIVAIADVFDALTSKRPYKEAFPLDQSIDIILEGKGTHFDPKIVDAFMENRNQIIEIYNKYNKK